MYREIKGDLLKMHKEGHFDYVCHSANCQKVMGAGIAGQIAEQFPNTYIADKKDSRLPIEKLGDMSVSDDNIINLYTQLYPGRNLDYTALELCLRKVNIMFAGNKIGLNKLSCGIAGGEWQQVKFLIMKELKDCNVTIVIYEK